MKSIQKIGGVATAWRFALAVVWSLCSSSASGDNANPTQTPYPSTSASLAYQNTVLPGIGPTQPAAFTPPAQPITQPPPGGWAMAYVVGPSASAGPSANVATYDAAVTPYGAAVTPAESPFSATVAGRIVVDERPIESTWYYRLDSFYWKERINGMDLVNEAGPISTIGYMHRNGPERFRVEVFGGTVAYDGNAMFNDGSLEAYHQSNGTNYLGSRIEYDLLIEPASWSFARMLAGVGTRFWIRDLRDSVTPSGADVSGYRETWWTFYPYIGLETKTADQANLHFFGSVRFGLTPLTYQYADYFGTSLYPKCGITGQTELGVTCRRMTASAFLETMTWSQSAVVRDTLQPNSSMLTLGGRISYSF